MRHKILKLFIIQALLLTISIFLVNLLSNVLLFTLCNAIFGSDHGGYANAILIRALLPMIITASFCILNAKDSETKRDYLKSIEGKDYDSKQDLTLVLHDRMYWAECIIFAILFLVMPLIDSRLFWVFLLSIPLFVIFDGWWRMHLHKSWANGRIRQ